MNDLEDLAFEIWGMVRLAQDPLCPSRSIRPLISKLETFREQLSGEFNAAQCKIRQLKTELKLLRQQTAWEEGMPEAHGMFAIQNRHQRPAIWLFDQAGWREVDPSSRPEGNFRRLRLLMPPGKVKGGD